MTKLLKDGFFLSIEEATIKIEKIKELKRRIEMANYHEHYLSPRNMKAIKVIFCMLAFSFLISAIVGFGNAIESAKEHYIMLCSLAAAIFVSNVFMEPATHEEVLIKSLEKYRPFDQKKYDDVLMERDRNGGYSLVKLREWAVEEHESLLEYIKTKK
ncbi:hypothetical protein D3C87_347940 [compost metagenome]